jgi:hypothetical protein
MTFTNPGQALSFLGAFLLGGVVGLVYDGLRVVRFRRKSKLAGFFLDVFFWLAVICALFCYAVWAGNGLVRVYMMAGMLGGGVVYFHTLSPFSLRFFFFLADLLGKGRHLAAAPFRFAGRIAKKIWKISKNLFSYPFK